MPSKYLPIWQKIKRDKKCTVTAHPLLFDRIAKAVGKQKTRDKAFAIANDRDDFRLDIVRDSEKHLLHFKLVARIGLEDIVVV